MNYERLVFYLLKQILPGKVGADIVVTPEGEDFSFQDFTTLLSELEDDDLLTFSIEEKTYTIRFKWGFEKWYLDYIERILVTYVILDFLYWTLKNNHMTSFIMSLYRLDFGKLPPHAFDLSPDSCFPALFHLEESRVFTKIKYGIDDDHYLIGVDFDTGTFMQYRKEFNRLFDEMQRNGFINKASIDYVGDIDKIEEIVIIDIEYSMGEISLKIGNGEKYIVSRPQVAKENDLIFEHLFNNPNRFVTKKEIEKEVLKNPMKKDFGKIIENLGFKKTLRKVLFRINNDKIEMHTNIKVPIATWQKIKEESFQ